MTTEINSPPIRTEYLNEPVDAPCPDCGEMIQTTRIWRNYTEDWQPTDGIESLDRCDSCYAIWRKKVDARNAEIARREAEAEARRQEIFARARASESTERQIEFDFESS